jgi:hypothetical protein
MTNILRNAATDVQKALSGHSRTEFSRIASEVRDTVGRIATEDHDAEWQRVNSYVADVLKDSHVLYAKLARLQGDFSGEELARLSKISEAVLAVGDELSTFSKAFYEGKYEMLQSEFTYGAEGGAPIPKSQSPEDVEAGAGGTPAGGTPPTTYDAAPPFGGGEGGGKGSEEAPEESEEDYEAPEEEQEEPEEEAAE